MKRRDYIAILCLLALALIAQGAISMRRPTAGVAIVSVSGAIVGRIPLDGDSTYRGQGAEGAFELAIEDGAVRMVSSTCKDALCVRQGAIRMAGQSIVCLPNRVSVRMDGAADGGMDAVAH